MDAVSAATFVVKLTVINPKEVITDPQFDLSVKSAGGVITHDGTLTGQSLVTTPFLGGSVYYQSLASETSDIVFDIFPAVANFDDVGLFHVEALTSGYSLSATQSFGQLGPKAKLSTVSGSDVEVVEKVEKVQKVYVDHVHIKSGNAYAVKMQVTKPGVASGAGEFRVALQTLDGGTLKDEEASNMTGPLLTVANKVKDTSISVGSKNPDTDTTATVRAKIIEATSSVLEIVVALGASHIEKVRAEDALLYKVTGFKLKHVQGFNAGGDKICQVTPTTAASLRRTLNYDRSLQDAQKNAVKLRAVASEKTEANQNISFEFPITTPSKEVIESGVGSISFSV
eukprot:Platyproteum_vivax@DN7636_c0_g1_i10.p1